MHKKFERQNFLIEVLLDRDLTIGERDDAAMDLDEFDSDEVLNALFKASSNLGEDWGILDVCGESIGSIWTKRDFFDITLYNSLPKWTQNGLFNVIKSRKPNWIKDYNLEPPFKGMSKRQIIKTQSE